MRRIRRFPIRYCCDTSSSDVRAIIFRNFLRPTTHQLPPTAGFPTSKRILVRFALVPPSPVSIPLSPLCILRTFQRHSVYPSYYLVWFGRIGCTRYWERGVTEKNKRERVGVGHSGFGRAAEDRCGRKHERGFHARCESQRERRRV